MELSGTGSLVISHLHYLAEFRLLEQLQELQRISKTVGRTPIAGMVHSITLVIVLVVLMPFAGMIPMPTIAAILFIVAYNMCQWRTFVHLIKTAPKSDIIVLISHIRIDC